VSDLTSNSFDNLSDTKKPCPCKWTRLLCLTKAYITATQQNRPIFHIRIAPNQPLFSQYQQQKIPLAYDNKEDKIRI